MKRLLWILALSLPAFAQHYIALSWTQAALPPNWVASTSYTAGQVICPTVGNAGAYEYFAQQGNLATMVSGTSEPTWPQTLAAQTAADGGITDWAMVTQGNSGVTCLPAASNNVYRASVSGGPYTKIYSSSTPITSYNDTGCTGACYYVVTGVNANGESAYSNETEGTEIIGTPTDLTVIELQ
jgi:hypothetical protein